MPLSGCDNVPVTTKKAIQRNPIAQHVTLSGTGSWLADTTIADQTPILRGRLGFLRGHSGLMVHATDTQQLDDLEMEFRAHAGLTISIMLEGKIDVRIGGQTFSLCDCPKTQARAWMLTEQSRLMRKSQKGQRIRKVHIMVTRDWLDNLFQETGTQPSAFEAFTRENLATTCWRPSKRVLSLAEQILNPPQQAPTLEKLYVESRAIEIIGEACAQFGEEDKSGSSALSTKQQARAAAITDYLDRHFQEEIPLTRIARDLGMSIASLQRIHKTAYNQTINDAIRERRLLAARDAMQNSGFTVGQAAYLAGYTDPANFSKAFKRRFGISPSASRS